jgi:hypothetical protein
MNPFYSAYQAYERRVIRGEFDNFPEKAQNVAAQPEPLLVRLGDLLIQTGTRLKMQHANSKPIAWSPLMGSKP